MATFVPEYTRVRIEVGEYGQNDDATYNLARVEVIAESLESLSRNWVNPWVIVESRLYQTQELCYVVLERAWGGEKSQIILAYTEDDPAGYLHSDNRWYSGVPTDRLWIAYKPHTTGVNINWATYNPVQSNFISDGNGFKFSVVCGNAQFYYHNWYYTWLADEGSDRIILIHELMNYGTDQGPHKLYGVTAFGDTVLDTLHNQGSNYWRGPSSLIAHPEPDTHTELLVSWQSVSDMATPEGVDSIQWYRTDFGWSGTYGQGIVCRDEMLGATQDPPHIREPYYVGYSGSTDREPKVWEDDQSPPATMGGNSFKGRVDPDFICRTKTDLEIYQLLDGGNFIHLQNGLCCGWDPAHGSMKTGPTL